MLRLGICGYAAFVSCNDRLDLMANAGLISSLSRIIDICSNLIDLVHLHTALEVLYTSYICFKYVCFLLFSSLLHR